MSAKSFQRAFLVLFVALLIYLDYRMFRLFLSPLAWAAVLAITFYPVHQRLARRLKKPGIAAVASAIVVLAVLVVPAIAIATACVQQGIMISREIGDLDILPKLQELLNAITTRVPIDVPDLENRILEAVGSLGSHLAEMSANFAGNAAQFFLNAGVLVLALFFMFRDGPKILTFLRDTAPMETEMSDQLFTEAAELVTVTLQSTVVVALAQGAVAAVVFWILGLPAPVFFGALSAFLAFLPVVGPSLVWAPAAIILLVAGEYWRGVAMLLLGNFGISGIDNVLRPLLIAGKAQLNSLLSMLSVLGGIAVFGFLGIVLGPLLVALTIGMLETYREQLRREDDEAESAAAVP
jgi:predicted PurR-regulated permease PerM